MSDVALTPATLAEVTPRQLTQQDARALTDEVREDAAALWHKLLALYEGQAHKTLGYESWAKYCKAEFGEGKSRAYQLIEAARVHSTLVESGSPTPVTERQARELSGLDPDQQQEIAAEISEQHGGFENATARQVRDAANQVDLPKEEQLEAAKQVRIGDLVGDKEAEDIRDRLDKEHILRHLLGAVNKVNRVQSGMGHALNQAKHLSPEDREMYQSALTHTIETLTKILQAIEEKPKLEAI